MQHPIIEEIIPWPQKEFLIIKRKNTGDCYAFAVLTSRSISKFPVFFSSVDDSELENFCGTERICAAANRNAASYSGDYSLAIKGISNHLRRKNTGDLCAFAESSSRSI
jgi:hypothetical protein